LVPENRHWSRKLVSQVSSFFNTICGSEINLKKSPKKHKYKDSRLEQKTRREKDSETQISEEQQIKCNKCDYTTTSRQGLKIHRTKVHLKID
jgi:hypothetical protein